MCFHLQHPALAAAALPKKVAARFWLLELSHPHPSSVAKYSKTNGKSGHFSNSPIPSWCYRCSYHTGYSHPSFRVRYNLLLLVLNQSASKSASYAKRKSNLSTCPAVRLARVILLFLLNIRGVLTLEQPGFSNSQYKSRVLWSIMPHLATEIFMEIWLR